MVRLTHFVPALLLATALSLPALAAGDAQKGKRVFNKCRACHVVDQEKNRIGPHLVGLFGRKAGAVEGFKYSKAMNGSGIVWNEDTLDAYLKNPRGFIKGTRMVFSGLKKDQERADLIAWLKSVTRKQ